MKEKLELKHINPYADKALKGLFHGAEDIVTGIDYEHGIISSLNTGSVLIRDFKPLLHPLERLTKPILEDGLSPIAKLQLIYSTRLRLDENGFYYHIHESVVRGPSKDSHFPFNQLEAYNYIFEWHFDVFGLIEKGLAEPIKI